MSNAASCSSPCAAARHAVEAAAKRARDSIAEGLNRPCRAIESLQGEGLQGLSVRRLRMVASPQVRLLASLPAARQ